jgi:hypothetical protein
MECGLFVSLIDLQLVGTQTRRPLNKPVEKFTHLLHLTH